MCIFYFILLVCDEKSTKGGLQNEAHYKDENEDQLLKDSKQIAFRNSVEQQSNGIQKQKGLRQKDC